MAKFLQETISESGLKAEGVVGTEEFKEFFRKVRSTGESASPEDIIKVAKLFKDDFTLDNLSRPQLVSMCRYMNINAFGTDNFLKHQIRARLEKIRVDDMVSIWAFRGNAQVLMTLSPSDDSCRRHRIPVNQRIATGLSVTSYQSHRRFSHSIATRTRAVD
jgi:hypothetical protein